MKKIAISIGDLNGIGIQLILENHRKISKLCNPIYCINDKLLQQAANKLRIEIPNNFALWGNYEYFKIRAGRISKKSGLFSYYSFLNAIDLATKNKVDSICTMAINKESWAKANIKYVGHTDMLRDIFKKNAIMMLGCNKMFVALFTEHIPLKDINKHIKIKSLTAFLLDFAKSINSKKTAVLGLNPHAGDNGVLGKEEDKISKAIKKANNILKNNIFEGVIVPDIAFTKNMRKKYKYFVCMYHDQGLIPLKTLYFDKSINISLNLPILRTSVDHGTAFDIAYQHNNNLSNKSYINAIKELL
ncbi:4-hydroxythreonine-4-phosphate dehydrogenase [hydrothermal vent metagenome]|uniref:4-hydroxythreonine-4-phosphate dehydrogenase n=1 Tax=hydrothermal vent metagenome TaxID=652676 RepID=A0A3B1DW15_9ZZZZ